MTAVKVICGYVMMLTIFGTSVFGYMSFREEIPNGFNIPDPCSPGSIWNGVGHHSPEGKDDRNLFGLAFLSNSKTWTKALCQSDSDGDGRSNGLEMGDPNCTWTKGGTPSTTTGLSHPGICEPVTADACQSVNSFLPAACRQAQSTQAQSTQAPSSQAPSTQAPSTQAPSTLTTTTKRSGGGSSEATLNRSNILSLVAFVFGTVFIRIIATRLS